MMTRAPERTHSRILNFLLSWFPIPINIETRGEKTGVGFCA
jgi:hypothetical protein